MKRRIASILAFIAMIATGAASVGCVIVFADEPKAFNELCD